MAGFLIGSFFGITMWWLLVPWDLSGLGDDEFGLEIAAVGVLIATTSVVLLVSRSARPLAGVFAAGGLSTWAVLFAWRAGTAEMDSGANFFMIPLLMVIVPLTLLIPPAVHGIAHGLDRRGSSDRVDLTS